MFIISYFIIIIHEIQLTPKNVGSYVISDKNQLIQKIYGNKLKDEFYNQRQNTLQALNQKGYF